MVETTLGIMTFFEYAFALASFSRVPGFPEFLHQGTEVQGRVKDLQAKQFKFLCLLMLLCFHNKTGQVRSPGRVYRNFGSGPRERHPGPRIFSLLLGYFLTVKPFIPFSVEVSLAG